MVLDNDAACTSDQFQLVLGICRSMMAYMSPIAVPEFPKFSTSAIKQSLARCFPAQHVQCLRHTPACTDTSECMRSKINGIKKERSQNIRSRG